MIFDKQKIKEKVWKKLPRHYTTGDICYLTVVECQKQLDEAVEGWKQDISTFQQNIKTQMEIEYHKGRPNSQLSKILEAQEVILQTIIEIIELRFGK